MSTHLEVSLCLLTLSKIIEHLKTRVKTNLTNFLVLATKVLQLFLHLIDTL